MSATVRISQASCQVLRQIAAQVGEPMQTVLDKAREETVIIAKGSFGKPWEGVCDE
ncbi:MAG: hypothetical protein DDT21_00538 [Syntrophomonadaceae bacterium]|nr:hypothetical protein [Bacillota bacterium]